MQASTLLERLPTAFRPAAAGGQAYTIQLNISTPAYAAIRDGVCEIGSGQAAASDVTLTLSDQDFIALMQGKLNGVTAFMGGKLKVSGDLMLAQRLPNFFDAAVLQE